MALIFDAVVDILIGFGEAGGGDVLVGDGVRGRHFEGRWVVLCVWCLFLGLWEKGRV